MIRDSRLPGKFYFAQGDVPAPPRSLSRLCDQAYWRQAYEGPQRRAAKRLPVVVSKVALPLDDDFQPRGAGFAAITGDLSTAGLRLFSTRAVTTEFLAVELTPPAGQSIQVVLQVLRCKAVGRFYEIAGRLVARTGN